MRMPVGSWMTRRWRARRASRRPERGLFFPLWRGYRRRPGGNRRRSIPAWAGQTVGEPGQYGVVWVYPRVGGANKDDGKIQVKVMGLSPRGRGKRLLVGAWDLNTGSIPAWAGQTP